MTATEFVDRVTRGEIFRGLETRQCDELRNLLPWLELLRTEPIQDWFFGTRAGKLACRAETPLTPVLKLLLRRHLLSIPNRTNPTPLQRFWERAAGQADPTLRAVWDGAALAEAKDETVAGQEARFTRELERAARELVQAGGPAWAEETVRTLLAERPTDEGTLTHVSARVVFGWEPPDRALFRDGVLVDLRLLAAGAGLTPVTTPEVFDARFLESLARVRSRIDAEALRQMEHRWGFLPPGFLAQTSGTAAVFLAQWLASRSQFAGGRYHALPPWVVVSGTFDFDGPAPGGTLGPAGLLAEKGRVLLEEGVRCLVVSAACDASRLPSSESLHVLRTTGGMREIAAELLRGQLVLPADLKPLDSHLLKRPPQAELNQPAVRDRARFRHTNLAESYVPPVYAFTALEAARQQLPGRGVIHVVAEGMMGKSVLVKALKDGWTGTPREVGATLGYAVLHGRPEDPWLFLSEIAQQARDLDPDGTLGLRHLPDDARGCKTLPDVHRSLVEVLSAVRTQFCRSARPVLLAVDGLDELTARDDQDFACRIDELLPPAASLADGCYLLVTSRPALRTQVRAVIDGWRGAADLYRPVELSLDDPGYRAALEGFLLKHCGEAIRPHVGQILRLADSRFLYVHFLSALLDERTVRETPPGRLELPAGDAIFPAYLDRLAAAVVGGVDAFRSWHRPLLLLIAAAYEPVTRGHLRSWLKDRAWDRPENNQLDLALNELGILLREERPADEQDSRYRVAHRQILEWLRTATHPDWAGALLREGHRRIAEFGVAVTTDIAANLKTQKQRNGARGTTIEMGQVPADALAWAPSHLLELGEYEAAKRVLDDPDLTNCSDVMIRARSESWQKGRALDLYTLRIDQHRRLAQHANHRPTTALAVLYANRSESYRTCGRIPEAVRDVADAMALVEHSPDSANSRIFGTLHVTRAKISLDQNQPDQAWADFDRAIALLRMFVGRNGNAPPRTFQEMVHHSAHADAYFHRGEARMLKMQVGDAVQDFTEAIKLHRVIARSRFASTGGIESHAAALRHRAVAHTRLGDTAKAQGDFRDAVAAYRLVIGDGGNWQNVARRSPGRVFDFGGALVEFGAVEVRRKRVSQGLALYREGIEQLERLLKVQDAGRLARESPGHLYGFANAYLGLPQLRQSAGKTESESLLEPSVEFCRKALALVRVASDATAPGVTPGRAAEACYQFYRCHATLSGLYFESGRLDEALAEAMNATPYLRSVLASPDDLRGILASQHEPLFQCVPVWINLANAFSRAGRAARARPLLDCLLASFPPLSTVLERDPRYASLLEVLQFLLAGAYYSRGSGYLSDNQPDAALGDFDHAERIGVSRLTSLLSGPTPGTSQYKSDEFVCVMAAVYGNRCAANRELHRLEEAARDADRLVAVLGFLCRMAGPPRAALDRYQHVLTPLAQSMLDLGTAQARANQPAAGKRTFDSVSAFFRPLIERYGTVDGVVGRHTELLELVGSALMNAGWESARQGKLPEAIITWFQAFQWLAPYLARWQAAGVEAERHDRLVAAQDRVHQWLRQCNVTLARIW